MASSYRNLLEEIRNGTAVVPCDFRRLKDALSAARAPEDNVVYQLNRVAGRFSRTDNKVSCEQLWRELDVIRAYRLGLLAKCRQEMTQKLQALDRESPEDKRGKARRETIRFEMGFLETEMLYEESLKQSTVYRFEQVCASSFN